MMTVTVEERDLIENIISKNTVCHVGMIDKEGMPYVIPMNFGYKDDFIYLHSAPEGGSIEALKINPNVCITFCTQPEITYQHVEVACSYRVRGSSVIAHGKVEFINDFDEKIKILNIFMKQYTERVFAYSAPAVNNVCVWKVEVNKISAKVFGVPHPNSRNYKESKDF